MAPPEAGVTVMVTVDEASAVPTSTGVVLAVMPSVDDVPVSLAGSGCSPVVGVAGPVPWASTTEPVPAVDALPAASVETTDRPTVPSTRPPAGSVPVAGVAVAVSMDQLPLASAVV